MPQIGWLELLIIVVVAILVIGPKDFPIVLRKLGKWSSTIKKYFSDVQSNINEITNLDLVENIIKILESHYNLSPRIKFVGDRKGHDARYAINMKKTNSFIGELPRKTFQENLEKTIAWYVKNSDWWDR